MINDKKGIQSEWILIIALILFLLFLILKAFNKI